MCKQFAKKKKKEDTKCMKEVFQDTLAFFFSKSNWIIANTDFTKTEVSFTLEHRHEFFKKEPLKKNH